MRWTALAALVLLRASSAWGTSEDVGATRDAAIDRLADTYEQDLIQQERLRAAQFQEEQERAERAAAHLLHEQQQRALDAADTADWKRQMRRRRVAGAVFLTLAGLSGLAALSSVLVGVSVNNQIKSGGFATIQDIQSAYDSAHAATPYAIGSAAAAGGFLIVGVATLGSSFQKRRPHGVSFGMALGSVGGSSQ